MTAECVKSVIFTPLGYHNYLQITSSRKLLTTFMIREHSEIYRTTLQPLKLANSDLVQSSQARSRPVARLPSA